MINAFKDMIKRWNDFTGRSNLGEYWWAQLAIVIITFVIGIVGGLASVALLSSENEVLYVLFGIIVLILSIGFIFLVIADLALTIRRIRDAGFPWWFWFANFIPSVGNIAVIVFCCLPTSDTPRVDFGGNDSNPPKPASSALAENTVPEQVNETWTCKKCGAESTGKFCAACGEAKE